MDPRQVTAGAILLGVSGFVLPAEIPPTARTALLFTAMTALVLAVGAVGVSVIGSTDHA